MPSLEFEHCSRGRARLKKSRGYISCDSIVRVHRFGNGGTWLNDVTLGFACYRRDSPDEIEDAGAVSHVPIKILRPLKGKYANSIVLS